MWRQGWRILWRALLAHRAWGVCRACALQQRRHPALSLHGWDCQPTRQRLLPWQGKHTRRDTCTFMLCSYNTSNFRTDISLNVTAVLIPGEGVWSRPSEQWVGCWKAHWVYGRCQARRKSSSEDCGSGVFEFTACVGSSGHVSAPHTPFDRSTLKDCLT